MKYKIIKVSAISAFGLLASLQVQSVFAEEIVIENNGSGATSDVHVKSEAKTDVNQENTVEIANNVDVQANTGGNESLGNTNGNTTIETGDVTVDVNIHNSGNVSVSDTSCCTKDTPSEVTISGNGAKSTNTVNASNTSYTTGDVTNTANVTNNINGQAVTGKNNTSHTTGDVTIKTGSIHAKETILNGPFNLSYIQADLEKQGYIVSISGNGSSSENTVTLHTLFDTSTLENNQLTVYNRSAWDLITGENKASKNNGDVVIKTGDVVYKSEITNKGNVNYVDVTCCEKDKPVTPDQPDNPLPPSNGGNGGNGGGNGGSGSSGGSSGSGNGVGSSIGDILPATGGSFLLLFLLVNSVFLLFGAFMRLRAGRSPALALAI